MEDHQVDWAFIRQHAMSSDSPPDWPPGVKGITLKGVALLGLDDKRRLYWDGRRVATLTLSRWQKIGAFVLTMSAAVAAMAATASAVAAWKGLERASSVTAQAQVAYKKNIGIGNGLHDVCQSRMLYDQGACWGYITGASEVLAPPSFCAPSDLSVAQVYDVITAELANHPEERNLHSGDLIIKYLGIAWPCASKK